MNDLFDLTGKVAVVTGGSRGIGLMAARGLLQAGAKVYIVARHLDACEAAAAELSALGSVTPLAADLSTREACHEFAAAIAASEDHVDILVNNAGATWGAPLEDFPASGWDKVLDLNLKSPFFLVQEFLTLLKNSATPDDPSRVINIGSIDGLRVPTMPTYSYSSSKAAIHHLTKALAVDLGSSHIAVNAIAPGPFESKMMAATLDQSRSEFVRFAPLGRIGCPDDIAGVVVFLAGRSSAYVTGAVLPVDGGISLVSPR